MTHSLPSRRSSELGDAQVLARYQRWRGLDNLMVAAATDGLTRLFGVRGKAASAIRRFGISAVDRIPPLKDRLMAERSEEHTSELQSLMRISYDVFCLQKKKKTALESQSNTN